MFMNSALCQGKTAQGEPCTKMTKQYNRLCHHHQNPTPFKIKIKLPSKIKEEKEEAPLTEENVFTESVRNILYAPYDARSPPPPPKYRYV